MSNRFMFYVLFFLFCIRLPVDAQPGQRGPVFKQAAVFERITTNPASDYTGGNVSQPRDGYINLYLKPEYAGRVTEVVYQVHNQINSISGTLPVTVSGRGSTFKIPDLSYNSYVLVTLRLDDGRVLSMDTTEAISVYSAGVYAQPRDGSLQRYTREMEGPNVARFITSFNQVNGPPPARGMGGNTPLGCNDGRWVVVNTLYNPVGIGAIIVAQNSCGEKFVFGCISPGIAAATVGDTLISNGGNPCDQSLILLPLKATQKYQALTITPAIRASASCLTRDPLTGAHGSSILTSSWTYYSPNWGSGTGTASQIPYTYTWDRGLGTGDTKTVSDTGTYTVTLTIANCSYTASVRVGRNAFAGQNSTDSTCAGTGPVDLNARTPNKDGGGTWARYSGTGGTFDAASATFAPPVTAGTHMFTYTVAGTNGCAAATSYLTMKVLAAAYAGRDTTIGVCSTSAVSINLANVLTGEQAGGTWVRTGGTGGTFNAANGTFIPTNATTSTFTYSVAPIPPCTQPSMSTVTVRVVPPPNAGRNVDTTFCSTSPILINLRDLVAPADTGGSWTRLSGSYYYASPDTFNTRGAAASTSFRYTVAGADGCSAAYANVVIRIVTGPNAGTDGATRVCGTSTTTIYLANLITGEQTGGTWVRTSGTGGTFNAAAATFLPTGATTSTFTYTVTPMAPCTIPATSTATVTVTPPPNAGRNVDTTFCSTEPVLLHLRDLVAPADTGGTWMRLTGSYYYACPDTFNTRGAAATTSFLHTVAGADGCSAAYAYVTIRMAPGPNAGTNGSTSVCSTATTLIYLANLITGEQAGGFWSRSSGTGGTFDAAAGTFMPTGSTTSTFNYTVNATAPCTAAAISTATVNIIEPTYAGDNGDTTICDNVTPTISLYSLLRNAPAGGTWTRVAGTGGTFTAASGSFRPAGTPGTMDHKFVYSVSGTCGVDTASVTIHIIPCCALDVRVSSTPISCTTSVSTVTATVAGGGSGNYTYRWAGPNGFSATTASFTTSTAGTYTVTVTDVTGNCSAQGSTTVTATGNIPVLVLSGNNPVCNNSPVTITASVYAGTGTAPFTYVFSNNSGAILQSGSSNTLTMTPNGISSIIVKVVDASGCEAIQSIPVNSPGPALTLTNIVSICAGQQTTIKADDGGIAGYTYVWLDDNSTNPVRTIAPLTTTRYTVVRTTPQGCKDTATSTVEVFAKPVIVSIDSTQPACGMNNGSITVHASGDTAQLRYRLNSGAWQRSNVFSNLAGGSYTITVGNQNGTCQDTTTPPIVLHEANNIVSGIAGPSSICALENGYFVANPGVPGGTYRWSATGNPQITGDTVSSTFTAQWAANQAGTTQSVTMTVSLAGCTQTYTKPVVVTNAVFANAGPDKAICPNAEVSIGVNPNQAGPPGASFSWSPSQYVSGSNRTSSVLVKPPVTTDFILTVTDTINGCTRSDTVRVRVDVAVNPIADAGPDRILPVLSTPDTVSLGGPTTTQPGMEPNTTIGYLWTAMPGSPIGALSATNVANPLFRRPAGVTTATEYTYVFMVQKQYTGASSLQGVTCPVFDTVKIRFSALPTRVLLSPKVLLQGALYGRNPVDYPSDSIMRDNLRAQNKIPLTTPYPDLKNPITGINAFVPVNNAPETINGPFPASVILGNNGDNSIVDWVFLELRSASDPQKVIATRSALVQRDGDVVDVDGFSPVAFDNVTDLNSHLVIRHRNHLGVMTRDPLQLSTTTQTVDFTHSPANGGVATYGSHAQKELPGGHLALWAGNVNADRFVIFNGGNNDQNALQHIVYNAPGNTTQNLSYIYNAYTQGDVDMRGTAIYQGAGNDANYISENVFNHPANVNNNQTYVMFEQVPPRNN
jgi:hypothetical protein